MFERFTDRARRIMVLAQEAARALNHNYIGTEHLLLGLIVERDGIAARALTSAGITEDGVRQQIGKAVGHGPSGHSGQRPSHIPFTPQAKKVLELSLRESTELGHTYIGTEHLLLGLVREGKGPGPQILAQLGAPPDVVREHVMGLLHGYEGTAKPRSERLADRPAAESAVQHDLMRQLLRRLDTLEGRLSVLERRVGTGPDVADLTGQIAQVRREKEAAISAQNFGSAAALRGREKQLAAERDSRWEQWSAAHQDLPSLSEEVERLRGLLRQHGLDAEDGTA